MKYTSNTKPGMGDPYWYEWSVGLQYIIDMLNPDSGISYIELQADVPFGLDDVVVTYENGEKLFIQVKHTRACNTLTFGDLVSISNESGQSLLRELASGWNKEKDKYSRSSVLLYTNRLAGNRIGRVKSGTAFQRPALINFLPELKEQLDKADSFSDIQFPDYEEAWTEWASQLDCIDDDSEKLRFLKCLSIETDNDDLSELENTLIHKLRTVFQTNEIIAEKLLEKLDHALRTWSTSNRSSSKIDKEEVYRNLSVAQETLSYNQNLIPNEPFFPSREKLVKSLEDKLRFDHHKIVFLSGIPGCGKTNIISKLSSKRESQISIRYYAYEPINPEKEYFTGDVSRRVDKDYFWNELFNQLRRLLKGQLSRYNVPVINELMTLEEKRKRFFEIASRYADDRGIVFVVAIDGIDHAARSSNIENTFLPTLPNPEYIPSNVKILLAGQPKANYHNYPDWLFSDTANVIEIDVPSLLLEDIQSLVNAGFTEESPDYKQQLSELISKYAEGNTLAAIFAVHEASLEPVLFKLEKNLKDRKLSGNIHEYYRTIWNSAISRIQTYFIDYKVAGVFAFFNEPVNENKLYSIFPEERFSVSNWRNVLKDLHPLLSEEAGNYTILHNDVRVFLSSIIEQDQDHVQEVYSNLTDYYIALVEKNEAYYRDVFRFMKASGRLDEFQQVYSPEFIIAAYVYGLELDAITEITLSILKEVKGKKPINWIQMRLLAFGFMTLDQIEKSNYEIETNSFRRGNNIIPIHPFECYVETPSSWNNTLVSDVLSLTEKLYQAGLIDRANGLFKRWFSEMTVSTIFGIVELQKDEVVRSTSTEEIAKQLGVGIVYTGEYRLLEGIRVLAENHNSFVFHIMDAAFETIIKVQSGDEIEGSLKHLDTIYFESLLKGILTMLSEDRLSDIYIVAVSLADHLNGTPIGVLFKTFMEIVSFKAYYSQDRKQELWEQIYPIEFEGISFENENAYYSIYAITAAFLQSKSFSVVANEIVEKYIRKNPHRNHAYCGVYFNNVCLIGKWLSCYEKGEPLWFDANDLNQLLQALFLKNWNRNISDYEINKLRSHILKAYIFLSNTASEQIRKVVDSVCQQSFENNPANSLLDAGFYFYSDNNERQKQWYDEWLGNDGRVWQEPIAERNSIIHHFVKVVRLYDISKSIDMSEALEKARWSIVGYVSHKEYSCDYLLEWYKSLVRKNGTVNPCFATLIKEVSDQTEELGDNRIEYQINSRVFGDLFTCGFQTIKETLQNSHYLCQGLEMPSYLVDGLIGYLKDGSYDQESLLKIWAIGMAVLDWKDDENHATIHSLQRAIELCAERSGIPNIHALLEEIGPAYIDLASDPIRFVIPERWCDDFGKMEDELVSDEIIKSYLDGEKINKDTIAASIAVLTDQGKIEKETLIGLLEFELAKDEWGIARNPIISYLYQLLPSTDTDILIDHYLSRLIEQDHSYLITNFPSFVLWQVVQQDGSYGEDGLMALFTMHKNWMTSAGHFQEPKSTDNYDYTQHVDWERVTDIYSLFYQIIKVLILSEDADAARTALSGLFALESLDESYVDWLELDWTMFHYRAKEWLMMTYELLWDLDMEKRPSICRYIEAHCKDEDFNVALYANLLRENIMNGDCAYIQIVQPYFDLVPSFGARKLIRAPEQGPFLTGGNYVTAALSLLKELIGEECSDIEERTVLYSEIIDKELFLIPLDQHRIGGCKVTLDKIILAFLRVLYKDWVSGRWEGNEAQIARVVLSASEPIALLITPSLWKNNNCRLIKDTEDFIKQPDILKNNLVKEEIETGLSDDEVILAGSIRDYTHNKEIFGFYLSYIDFLGFPPAYASHQYERNSRFFLQRREDFLEDEHLNITLHHNGVESFKDSNISCGLSKKALNTFGWSLCLSRKGFLLLDSKGAPIGHHECYYAFRSTSNRYPSNQPSLQRWIIKRYALDELSPLHICTVVDSVTNEFM